MTQTLLLTFLLLAEVVVLIKRFCTFLETRNLNYDLVIGKFELLFPLLEKFGESLPHYKRLDCSLNYFSKVNELLSFAKESSELSRPKQV